MPETRTILFALLLLTSAFDIGLAALLAQRRFSGETRPLRLLLWALALYPLAYGFQLASSGFSAKELWNHVEYTALAIVPILWLSVAYQFLRRKPWPPGAILVPLCAISSLSILVNWTDTLHHLFTRSITLNDDGPFTTLLFHGGPWYWIQFGYFQLCMMAGIILFIKKARYSSRRDRSQALLMIVSILLPWIGTFVDPAIHLHGLLEPAPFLFAVTSPVIALALFRYRFLDVVPIARSRIIESIHDGVITIDEEGRIVDVNPAARTYIPILSDDIYGKSISVVLAHLPAILSALDAGSPVSDGSNIVNLRSGSDMHHFQVSQHPLYTRRGIKLGSAILLSDVTEQKRMMDELRVMAIHDELTGLYNRRQFFMLARREFARAIRERISTAMIQFDIDHFKRINDENGHAAGDEVLKAVGTIARTVIRESDVLARLGGEEFVVLLPNTRGPTAVRVAERLRTALAVARCNVEHAAIQFTASFGVAWTRPTALADVEKLLIDSDRALYAAKNSGRNRVEVNPKQP